MVCYPVCHYPCRTILDDATRYVLQGRIKEGFSWSLHVILTLVLCGAALGTSLLTSDLGTVSFPCHLKLGIAWRRNDERLGITDHFLN